MKTLPLLAAALLALPAAADEESAIAVTGAELGAWTQDYAAATNAAAASGKPVFLDFTGSDWCGWCMLMERQVFSKPEWKDWAATNVYLVALDFPRDKSKVPEDYQKRNRELSDRYGIRGYPTYVVLDSNGKKLGQLGASVMIDRFGLIRARKIDVSAVQYLGILVVLAGVILIYL